MPPIINGNLTKVTTETRNILIDITGTDKNAVENTLNIIVCALADRGGNICSVKMNMKNENENKTIIYPDLSPNVKEVSTEFINKKLGLNLCKNFKIIGEKHITRSWREIVYPAGETISQVSRYEYFQLSKNIKEILLFLDYPIFFLASNHKATKLP